MLQRTPEWFWRLINSLWTIGDEQASRNHILQRPQIHVSTVMGPARRATLGTATSREDAHDTRPGHGGGLAKAFIRASESCHLLHGSSPKPLS
jgi:hypothetical protein